MSGNFTYEIKAPARIVFDTYGGFAVSFLLICIISGIILAVPYDVANAYLSISELVLTNAGATLARNMHYWSAQFFLIFSLLHIWDHFRIRNEKNFNIAVWFRLSLSIFVIFFAMLSGFILKADTDSMQALLIFRSLIEEIPLAGSSIAYALLGSEDSLQLLYVNHISLATIFLLFILFEHSRIVWGKAITFIILGFIILVFSILFQAPLHDNQSQIVKGPWYFLGLQEMLHWMKRPGLIWIVVLLAFLPVFIMPWLNQKLSRIAKYFLFFALIFYILLTIIGYFFRGEEWKWSWDGSAVYMPFNPVPILPANFAGPKPMEVSAYGRSESCMICHEGMTGFSPAHEPAALGCVSCHLGNPFSPDKEQAHAGMLAVPGNLDNAERSCGTANCHPDITTRIQTTLMTTMSGIIAVDRFAFNESSSPDGHYTISDIGHSAADQHLRNLCSRCHLGNHKDDPGAVTEQSRGGGCNACHLNYSAQAEHELKEYFGIQMPDSSLWTSHPSLDLNISNDHCFGCHSRSGRISTSYEGWHETLLSQEEVNESDGFRILEDGRVFRYITDDVHHAAGLRCIDCHDSYELMGDGNLYQHEEGQVMIRCEDCHFDAQPEQVRYTEMDAETQKILQIKGMNEPDAEFLPLGNSGRVIWNCTLTPEGKAVLIGKQSRKSHPMKPPANICKRGNSHDELTCRACHAAWVPQCIGCHNEYDPKVAAYDMIDYKEEEGGWVEFVGLYLADLPSLGVVEGENREIGTFTPGMILSIDKSTYEKDIEDPLIFHRYYAPISSHTTAAKGRSCRSCHNEPLAIGYGHGALNYKIENGKGFWEFAPQYANNSNDGLPEDAWIPFLKEPDGRYSTRSNTRPFNLEEQKRILLVGSCLECHDENSDLMLSTLDDFEKVISRRSAKCILPDSY